jgi:hypothetical protein
MVISLSLSLYPGNVQRWSQHCPGMLGTRWSARWGPDMCHLWVGDTGPGGGGLTSWRGPLDVVIVGRNMLASS